MNNHGNVDMSRVPVLAILGSTGTGKSRLGIELARRFSGEIISADSMQLYKSLDIVTAKVTQEERKMAPHHMLDIVDPLIPDFTVSRFRDMTLPIIDDLLARKKLPIIVGGTNYYIEALLWDILISGPETVDNSTDNSRVEETRDDGNNKKVKIEMDRATQQSNEDLYEKLKEVDPEMAKRLHPNNRRKIIRSLEVFMQHGVTHSELLKVQRTAGGCGLGGRLRYPNSVILWLQCDQIVLAERLDSRVDAMVETGLVQELLDFHRRYNEQRIASNTLPDYTKGIFQSIGFKEFHSYLVLSEEEKREKKALLEEGIDNLKLASAKYARTQAKWVRNRMIRRSDRQVPYVYTLDTTNVNNWDTLVYEKAVSIIEAILNGGKPEQKPVNESVVNSKVTDSSNEEVHYCDICERFFLGEQWNIHINSMKHHKTAKRKSRLAQEEAMAQAQLNRLHEKDQ
ncbi:tRNA dimethylallyltransferase isoform X2 [Halictus rubicundus]|uniref:tRNA dimethylallyltransferase isoform X2 n=1 Tax=Halictus rubicundus TaxID=77578 RepID=UPI00403641FA